jgi:hypothetical protein
MKQNRVIESEAKERILDKARKYIEFVEDLLRLRVFAHRSN